MGINWGVVPIGSVLPFVFGSYQSNTGASLTSSGLAVTDIEVYNGSSMTQRSSDAGFTLLDTDGIDIDGHVGINGFSIDTGDDTHAGFFAVGNFYYVLVAGVTVDGHTVNFLAGTFGLCAAPHTAGYPVVTIKDGTGTGEIDTASGRVQITESQIDQIVTEQQTASPTLADLVNAILDEALSGHTTAGTVGKALTDLLARIEPLAITTATVVADGSNSATTFETDLAETADDHWKHSFALILTGSLAGQVRKVSGYDGTTKFITVSEGYTGTPSAGVTVALVNR